ncbi:MAG: hypothetical protein QF652_03010 [Dehalococcoidia bacterium]|nr:hypothetical protein [Dehalococcoidia bacterium]
MHQPNDGGAAFAVHSHPYLNVAQLLLDFSARSLWNKVALDPIGNLATPLIVWIEARGLDLASEHRTLVPRTNISQIFRWRASFRVGLGMHIPVPNQRNIDTRTSRTEA